ncbi:MAG: DUF1127 domain-containing protein [Pseudomonadota bacterium]
MNDTNELIFLSSRQRLPAITVILVRAAVTWANWRMHARTRKSLKHLDAHLLDDVGLSSHQARREAQKPFWMT